MKWIMESIGKQLLKNIEEDRILMILILKIKKKKELSQAPNIKAGWQTENSELFPEEEKTKIPVIGGM